MADDESAAYESELVERLRTGSDAAVEEALRYYGGRLLAVARRILKDEHLAQDALQDAFIMAMNGLDRFDGRSRFGTWLYRIVVNAALMKLRKKSHKHEVPVGEHLPFFLDDGHRRGSPGTWGDAPERIAESHELRDMVLGTIALLPEDYRTIILLRDIEELNTQESADILGITPGAAKVRLHRARQALRELLDPYLNGLPTPETTVHAPSDGELE
ncbi:MAG: sigma-70 family RNA polymerase sigma factor [Planctomycetes bacterium]|nr:sigma-70 family RNA polymerase sigma factor [Planctomycetota bacterium]